MKMDCGIVSLEPIYVLLKGESNPKRLLKLDGKNAPGRVYTAKCTVMTTPVPECQGFYLWGFYEANRLWKNVYLGKAGLGRSANLYKRITEELKDERCFAWRPFLDEDAIKQEGRRIHFSMWHKYFKHWDRALKKQNTTHILWVSTPKISNENVLRIEADLIESLNPTANHRRPPPPKDLQRDTKQVFGLLRQVIHENRATAFQL